MASHQDLLDAIARVRAATGSRDAWQTGLSGEDIAAACSAWSSPSALGAVLTKIVAAHPEAFVPDPGTGPPPRTGEGLAADAIRGAETALAHQNSAAARVDLQVVTAVLNAHAASSDGVADLKRLQSDIESAVLSRTDLDTPAGAREFQRFLIGKLRDIRTVIDTAGLDATSKASLAAALAALYASTTPPPAEQPMPERPESPSAQASSTEGANKEAPRDPVRPELATDPGESAQRTDPPPLDLPPIDLADIPGEPVLEPAPPPAPMPIPAAGVPAPAAPPMATPSGWGGGMPAAAPFGGGLPSPEMPELGRLDPLPDRDFDVDSGDADDNRERESEPVDGETDGQADAPAEEDHPEDPVAVQLPDGDTVSAPNPQVAAAMTAAIAGTPIAEAFRLQGITLPAPGTVVAVPVEATRLVPGDIGILPDRHALALGNGKALLDGQIKPIAGVTGPGFLGWQHPPAPGPTTTEPAPTPAVPAPTQPAETAPS